MAATAKDFSPPGMTAIAPSRLKPNPFSLSIYGDPAAEIDDLLPSIREHGIFVADRRRSLPGNRVRGKSFQATGDLACAEVLDFAEVPCEVRSLPEGAVRHRSILEYNRQRRKSFSQLMREADAIEELWAAKANKRRLGNLRRGKANTLSLIKQYPIVGIPTIGTH